MRSPEAVLTGRQQNMHNRMTMRDSVVVRLDLSDREGGRDPCPPLNSPLLSYWLYVYLGGSVV